MTERTPEQVNRAIAAALGWTLNGEQPGWGIEPKGQHAGRYPDWYHDLNALKRAVESVLEAAGLVPYLWTVEEGPLKGQRAVTWLFPTKVRATVRPDECAARAEAGLAALLTLKINS